MSRAGRSQIRTQPLYGDDLLASLKGEGGGLTTRTLLTLVTGGLRVRLMRSIVTMISVVLAIAFLAYMGLFNHVQVNMANAITELENVSTLSPAKVALAVGEFNQGDLIGSMSVEDKRDLALALDLDDISTFEHEMAGLDGTISQMEGTHAIVVASQQELEQKPGVTEAELEDARAKTAASRHKIDGAKSRRALHANRIDLGRWLAGNAAADPKLADALNAHLVRVQSELLATWRTPSHFTPQDMGHAEHLLGLAKSEGQTSDAAATLKTVLAQERQKRAVADMRLLMRRAGVSVEATLAGNPMDTWLIVMALMTCTVGIANAMLMSVTERFREIGTMKCLGAQDALVVKLFLLESAFQGIVGAGLGTVVGLLIALISAALQFAGYGLTNFPVQQMWQVMGWSMLSGVVLAILGAVPSALMAARMNPVDALRIEE